MNNNIQPKLLLQTLKLASESHAKSGGKAKTPKRQAPLKRRKAKHICFFQGTKSVRKAKDVYLTMGNGMQQVDYDRILIVYKTFSATQHNKVCIISGRGQTARTVLFFFFVAGRSFMLLCSDLIKSPHPWE